MNRPNTRRRKPSRKPVLEALESRQLMTGPEMVPGMPAYNGLAIERGNGLYDLQPSLLYNPGDSHDANHNGIPDRLYTMAWLGRHALGDPDLSPSNLDADDRIYEAFSEDGSHWGTPQVVLKGEGGTGGAITADDHLVGSPSLLKVGDKFYMFYEAYSTWATPINRFYSFQRGDNWITNSQDIPTAGSSEGYAFERNLGFAPLLVKAGTHPVYSGEVAYNLPGGVKVNRYLTTSQPFVGQRDNATWSARNDGVPVMWLYDQGGPGRKPIYSFWDGAHANTYVTDDPKGEGIPGAVLVEVLGYAATSLDSPDMVGAMENRIMMATSTDGVNWTRFQGPARGGAVIAPQNERLATYNPSTWQIDLTFGNGQPSYGAGYPSALVRDDQLELYFTDEDSTPGTDLRRIRMPVGQIEDANAWRAARAPGNPSLTQVAPYGSDIKWSPLQQRYFVSYIKPLTPGITDPSDPAFRQAATILWSDPNPDPSQPPTFPAGNEIVLPAGDRVAVWGGLLGDGMGLTLDYAGSDPHTYLDLYFESYHPGFRDGAFTFDTDIAHSSVTMHRVMPAPDIAVDGITDGQATAVVVGRAVVGASQPIATFTVRNSGTAPLDLGAISLPNGFTLVQGLPASLQPGGSASFRIALDTSKSGKFFGTLSIASDDPDENPFNFPISGQVDIVAPPQLAVDGVGNHQATRIDFGSVDVGASGTTRTFVVRNTGGTTLDHLVLTVPAGFTVTDPLVPSLAPGNQDNITLRLDSKTQGNPSGDVKITSNDPDGPFAFPIKGRVVPLAPEIAIDGLADGQASAVDFGVGVLNRIAPTKTFVVRNLGTAALNLGKITLPAGFTLMHGLPSSLAPGASSTFTVRLDDLARGTFGGRIGIANNDPDENPFDFSATGVVVGSVGREIEVDGIADGQTTAIDFGIAARGGPASSRTFTVRNDGSTDLQLGSLGIPTGFSVVGSLPSTLGPGRSATFTIRLNTATVGVFSGQVSLINNDPNENPFNFPITGTVGTPAPEIAVSLNGTPLSGTNASVTIGTAYVNLTSTQATLTIANKGNSELVLRNWVVPAGFRLASAAPTSVAPGQSVTVLIRLDTSTEGIKSGILRFATNDSDESSFAISLRGKVYPNVTTVGGSPIHPINGTYTINAPAGTRISIDLANGRMPFGGSYVITITSPSGSTSMFALDSTLSRVVIQGSRQITVDNWTSLLVQYA